MNKKLMRKPITLLLSLILTVASTGCIPSTDEEQRDNIGIGEEDPTLIAPSIQVNEDYYRGLLPYVTSSTRGSLQSRLYNHRLDMDRLEFGLLEIAKDYFSVDDNLFREGQFITERDLSNWLRVKSDQNPQGLNPEGSSDRVLLHILEHDYWNIKGDSLNGVVVSLSLASTYTVERQVQTEDGQTVTRTETLHYTDDELRNYGYKMADQVVQRLRNDMDAPILVALYRLEENRSLVPGNFLSVGYYNQSEFSPSEWKTIDEIYFLFPSSALENYDEEMSTTYSDMFKLFEDQVQEYFPEYVGIIGTGRFVDGRLVELTINVNTEFAAKTEVIQLTQFLSAKSIEYFPSDMHLNIYVQSIGEPQAVFIRPIEGEPTMHIYR